MGRKKGSLNKIKDSNIIKTIKLNKFIENSPSINDNTPYKWVNWGYDNKFPLFLLDLYHNSIIHKSSIDFLVSAILGEGIDYEAMEMADTESFPNFNDTWDSFMGKIALDYLLYGSFAFQIIKNRDNKSYSFFHQPFSTVRLGKKNDKNEIKYAYICKDWSNTVTNKPIEIEVFNFIDDIDIPKGKPYLFTYIDYNVFDEYYSSPSYISAIDAIRTDVSLKNYDLNAVFNNFTPSGILTLNQVADDDERNMILKNIEATFTNSDNANNLIITFRNSLEDEPAKFTPISANVDNVNIFSDCNERTINRILAAHKIANKGLIGLPMDNSGFASEGQLLQAAYNLLEKTTVGNYRKKIVNYINKLLSMNGIDTKIIIKPLSFNLIENKKEVKEEPKNVGDGTETVDKVTDDNSENEKN